LCERLAVKHLVVGDDFHFGNDRCGNFEFLQKFGQQHDMIVENTHTHKLDQRRISSTWVREALKNADFALAKQLLGRAYTLSGYVGHGDRLGRTIGVPTANIALSRLFMDQRFRIPLSGVYAVTVTGVSKQPLKGVANLGVRPTVSGVSRRLEVHLFDFHGDLYNQRLSVQFDHKVRDEQTFTSVDAMKNQIMRDIDCARQLNLPSNTHEVS